nr:MAG TPA: hypothetical protein [Bacteriophage sp.]
MLLIFIILLVSYSIKLCGIIYITIIKIISSNIFLTCSKTSGLIYIIFILSKTISILFKLRIYVISKTS